MHPELCSLYQAFSDIYLSKGYYDYFKSFENLGKYLEINPSRISEFSWKIRSLCDRTKDYKEGIRLIEKYQESKYAKENEKEELLLILEFLQKKASDQKSVEE